MNWSKFLYSAYLLLISITVQAQFESFDPGITFHNMASYQGNGLSVYDYDKDGWEDITAVDRPHGVKVYRNLQGSGFQYQFFFQTNADVNQILWGDIDNDNDADLFFTCAWAACKLYRNDGNAVFTDISSSLGLGTRISESEGASMGDFDNDGLLDIYITNNDDYIETNWLLHNLGNGVFEEVASAYSVDDGYLNSLQPSWVDLNRDGWVDLFISEDRFDVNKHFLNTGTGFVEIGQSNGMNMLMNAMSNTIADFDNDSDLDIYIANAEYGNALMQNEGTYFVDVAPALGITVNQDCWSAVWVDLEMDGWDDLYVGAFEFFQADRQNYLFRKDTLQDAFVLNNTDFTNVDTSNVFAAVKWDFDRDFQWDIATSNTESPRVLVWQNVDTTLKAFRYHLQGTWSNTEGIGAIVDVFHSSYQKAIPHVNGENFLSQVSQYQLVAVPDNQSVDSLVIHWPSGWVDTYYNLIPGGDYTFTEGETFALQWQGQDDLILCDEQDGVTVNVLNVIQAVWSNGTEGLQQTFHEPGIYQVIGTNEFGGADTVEFEIVMFEFPAIETMIHSPLCFGDSNGSVVLVNEDLLFWDGQNASDSISNVSQGNYEFTVQHSNQCLHVINIEVPSPAPLAFEPVYDPILCNGDLTSISWNVWGGTGAITATVSNQSGEWNAAGEYNYQLVDENNCTASGQFEVTAPSAVILINETPLICPGEMIELAYSISGGMEPYVVDLGTAGGALPAGEYSYMITDDNGCDLSGTIAVLETDPIIITLLNLQEAFNGGGWIEVNVVGGTPPYNIIWSNGTEGAINPNLNQGFYQCFVEDSYGCQVNSELYEIVDVHINEKTIPNWSIYPQPCFDWIHFSEACSHVIELVDMQGKVIARIPEGRKEYYVGDLAPGVYALRSASGCITVLKW